jgi:hypothetical protein
MFSHHVLCFEWEDGKLKLLSNFNGNRREIAKTLYLAAFLLSKCREKNYLQLSVPRSGKDWVSLTRPTLYHGIGYAIGMIMSPNTESYINIALTYISGSL